MTLIMTEFPSTIKKKKKLHVLVDKYVTY